MCLQPIRLYNPTKRISKCGGQNFSLEVPCGNCAECKELMRTAWYFRSYWQCKEVYDKNGYVYFDTLTYRNEDLPHVSDIYADIDPKYDYPCFNPDHFRRFMVDIRQYLRRAKLDVDIKYFLTTEYGMNPGDGKTFRPHYHVMFFVDNDVLDPFVLSELVAKYWKYGRTDGIPYQSSMYVLKHIFGKKYTKDFVHMRSVCNYVSKYITKDSDFEREIKKRINNIKESMLEGRMSYVKRCMIKDKYRKIIRCIDQFHRQSQGFGLYYLEDMSEQDIKDMFDTGMMAMPDKEVIKHVPLGGSYYERKLLYEKKLDKSGNAYWTLTELGKKYKLERLLDSIDRLEKRYDEQFMNIPYYHGEEADKHMEYISNLLDGRSFHDMSVYMLLYKGKIRYGLNENNLLLENKLSPFENDLGIWMQIVMQDVHELDDEDCLFHYASSSDKKRFAGSCFVTDKNLGNKDAGYVGDIIKYDFDDLEDKYYGDFVSKVHKSSVSGFNMGLNTTIRKSYYGNVISDEDFAKRFVINETTDYKFRDFDKLYCYMKKLNKVKDQNKQELFEHYERLKKVHKSLSKNQI